MADAARTGAPRPRDFDLARIDATLAAAHPASRFDLVRPVEPALVIECIAEAVETTIVGRPERWRWVVVDDPDARAALAVLHQRGEPDELDSIVASAPVLVLACQIGRPEPASEQHELSTFYGDVVPVIAAFTLVARRRGLATVWTTRHLALEAEAAQLLGIPRNVTQIALIPIAFRAEDVDTKSNAVPFDARTVFANRWSA